MLYVANPREGEKGTLATVTVALGATSEVKGWAEEPLCC